MPFRDSTLTWLLQDSILGISARAFLLATINPSHMAETASTLRYAQQYSILKTNLVHSVNALAKERLEQHKCVTRARLTLRGRCEISRGPSATRKWSEELLRASRVVRLLPGTLRMCRRTLGTQNLTAELTRKASSRDAGIARGGSPDGDGDDDLVEVAFPPAVGLSESPVVLRFPAAALETVGKPDDMMRLLANIMQEEEALREVQAKVRVEEARLRRQQEGDDE